MFTAYSEKSHEERAAIAKRNRDMEAGMTAAADFVRANEIVRDAAIELSVRSALFTNENWTVELSQEWRDFSLNVIENYTNRVCNSTFLEGERTEEELKSFFSYGLQFVVRELKNGAFEW